MKRKVINIVLILLLAIGIFFTINENQKYKNESDRLSQLVEANDRNRQEIAVIEQEIDEYARQLEKLKTENKDKEGGYQLWNRKTEELKSLID